MVPVRQDKRPQELRLSAKAAKDGKVVQRLLGIALILDGRGRSEAASLVGLDPQTLARAVQHYNADGIAGLKDRTSPGRPPKLTREQSAELKRMILAGPEDRDNGCPEYKVRHIVDLVKDKWGIGISPETARTGLHAMNLGRPCRSSGVQSEVPGGSGKDQARPPRGEAHRSLGAG